MNLEPTLVKTVPAHVRFVSKFKRTKKAGTATCACGRTISANKNYCKACNDERRVVVDA